ncbi:MAG: radical SAM protein [Clostridia bacterium]|nr:radical SAM protein [Clostridia bacterium]
MHYTKPVFRPAFEGDVPLLQVTDGCSYNKCSFCSMYRTVPFRVSPDEEVEEDLRELRSMYRHMPRLFLVNGDPFCLSTERLAKLGERIRYYFPECETISCFAHIPNFRSKTVDDLKLLRSLGFDQINIGVESAIDSVLDMFHKGYHVDDVYEQLGKLNEAGMQFSMNIIMGALGNGEYEALAKANSDLLNATQPYLIFTTTLYSLPGSELYDYMEGGNFRSNTYRQLILEQIDMLSQLRLRNTYYYGLHPANPIPFDGRLPEEQGKIIGVLKQMLQILPPAVLDRVPDRGAEGGILMPDNWQEL